MKNTLPNPGDLALERGLPANVECEQMVLGSILLQGSELFCKVCHLLSPDDFSVEKHRRIWRRLCDLDTKGEQIDRITLAQVLQSHGELESVDGLSYLCSLDDGMPKFSNVDSYVRMLRNLSTLRKIVFAANDMMTRAMANGESGADLIDSAESILATIGASIHCDDTWMSPSDVFQRDGLDNIANPSRGGNGLKTGWGSLDELLCGLQPGDFVLLAGRPSHGKSAAAVQIARNVAGPQNTGVAYISLEMSDTSLVRRMLCSTANVDSHLMRNGWLHADARTRVRVAANTVGSLPIWMNDRGGMTAAAIRASLKSLMARKAIGLVIIDHFHLVTSTGREEERQKFNQAADSFQRVAKELKVPFLVLAQLNRQCESDNRPPGLADLKETGTLEQNADVVIFCYRPGLYAKNRDREDLKGYAEFIIAKQRNGPVGMIPMYFKGSTQEFSESTDRQEEA